MGPGLDRSCEFAKAPHGMVHQRWVLQGPTPGKAMQSTGSKSKILGGPGTDFGHAETRE